MEKEVTPNKVRIIECPRDAMQGWKKIISTEVKIRYINALLQVGFDTIDFGSFVSPKAIPQMADTKEVVRRLNMQDTRSRLLAIVANEQGATDAVGFEQISYLGFPFSVSPTFQMRNTNSTMEQSKKRLEAIQTLCVNTKKQLVVYLSMGFGNPYGDPYDQETLLYWAEQMVGMDIKIISLADTVGLATPKQISFALHTLIPRYPDVVFGAHLHSTPNNWKDKLEAAFKAGCKRIDGALKGIGGCPMAGDELVGNMDTEWILSYLEEKNQISGLNKEALQKTLQLIPEVFQS